MFVLVDRTLSTGAADGTGISWRSPRPFSPDTHQTTMSLCHRRKVTEGQLVGGLLRMHHNVYFLQVLDKGHRGIA